MEFTSIPEPQSRNEIYQVGEKLAQLVEPVNRAKNRLGVLYDNRLNETGWGYWITPDFSVHAQSDPDHPFDISFNVSDPHGSTRQMVSIKHNGNEIWASFRNNFDWIDSTQTEMQATAGGEGADEVGRLIEEMKGRESAQENLVQLASSPVWGTPDGPEIKRGFRLTYRISPDGVKPILAGGTVSIPPTTTQELNKMTDALRVAARAAMTEKIELVRDTTMQPTPPLAPSVQVTGNF